MTNDICFYDSFANETLSNGNYDLTDRAMASFDPNNAKDGKWAFQFNMTPKQVEEIQNIRYELIQYTTNMAIREKLCIQAIINLFKKIEFYELTLQLHEGLLTDADFEKEVTGNAQKYFIDFEEIDDPATLFQIIEIVKKIGKNGSSVDQIAELFSIKQSSIEENTQLLLG